MPTLMRIIAMAFGVGAVGASLWLRAMNARAQVWPTALGQVIRSGLRPDPHDAGSSVDVAYRFSVGAKSFTSERIAFAALSDSLAAKERLVARFPAGSEVEVFYDPLDPENSVLIREPSSLWQWAAATGVAFVAIGAFAP